MKKSAKEILKEMNEILSYISTVKESDTFEVEVIKDNETDVKTVSAFEQVQGLCEAIGSNEMYDLWEVLGYEED